MSAMTFYATISINGAAPARCEVRAETTRIDVSSCSATKPNPRWTHVDAAGHFHAWSELSDAPPLPTLTPVHVPCDGACGDPTHTDVIYRCTLCHELVEPGRTDDSGPRSIPGRRSWTVVVYSDVPALNERVSILVDLGDAGELFGFARLVHQEVRQSMSGFDCLSELACDAVGRRSVGAR